MKTKDFILFFVTQMLLILNLLILKGSVKELDIIKYLILIVVIPFLLEMLYYVLLTYNNSFSKKKSLMVSVCLSGISVLAVSIFQLSLISSREIAEVINNSQYLSESGAISININNGDIGSTLIAFLLGIILIFSSGEVTKSLRLKKSCEIIL